MSAPAVAFATATSADGRFVLFDADATEAAPDEPPFDGWLESTTAAGLAAGWIGQAPGPKRLQIIGSGDAEAASGPSSTGDPETVRSHLSLPSGRLCFAGLDEAFAARNAELHPGAFGDVLEVEPGDYELTLTPRRDRIDRSERDALRGSIVRRGDETIARLVQGGVPMALVAGAIVAAAFVVAIALGLGRSAAGPVIRWTVVVVAVALVAWIAIVRTGAIPPVQRVARARRAVADADPDAILTLRRVGEARDQPSVTEAEADGSGASADASASPLAIDGA